MVRGGTNCLTIAFCHDIHEDAMLTVQDVEVEKFDHIISIFRRVRNELKIPMPATGDTVKLTDTQSKANGGLSHCNPVAHQR